MMTRAPDCNLTSASNTHLKLLLRLSVVTGLLLCAGILLRSYHEAPAPRAQKPPIADKLHSCDAGKDEILCMKVDDFQLLDHEGAAHSLYYYADAPAIVLMTQGNGCPIARNAMPTLRGIRDAYVDRGVKFFLLNSNLQDNPKSIAAEVREFGFDIPVLVDTSQIVGESLKVTRTGEVYVIEPWTKKVIYHGPIEDTLSYGRQRVKAENSYLTAALDALLAGQLPEFTQIDAPGCLVNFPERENQDRHTDISYSDTIAPMLLNRCVSCHEDGGIGPWAMTSYDMVRGFAPMIREVIRTDRMPPWNADPNIGHFFGDQNLTTEEIKTLIHWIEAGAPRGTGEDPLARPRPKAPDWPMGEPDVVLDMPAYDVPATGLLDYQFPFIRNTFDDARWLRAIDVKLGARQAVHHICFGHDATVNTDMVLNEWPDGNLQNCWGPGSESMAERVDIAHLIPAGGAFFASIHYTTFGKAVTDRTQVGLYFHKQPPAHVMRSYVFQDATLEIPPHAAGYEETAYVRFDHDALLYAAFPHAHLRGRASTVSLRLADGSEKKLLSLPNWDFNWQRIYDFKEPVFIPAGSKVVLRFTFDNSARNLAITDPGRKVVNGEQTTDEMAMLMLHYRWIEESSSRQMDSYQSALATSMVFGLLDDNLNDVLEEHEFAGKAATYIKGLMAGADYDKDKIIAYPEYFEFIQTPDSEASKKARDVFKAPLIIDSEYSLPRSAAMLVETGEAVDAGGRR